MNRNKLVLVEEAFDLLSQIKEKIKVVSLSGPPTTGKSTLLRFLMDRLGSEEEEDSSSGTSGIWMWFDPIPIPEGVLIVLDTQSNSRSSNDATIYPKLPALEFLISSALVFNTSG
ncbi:MAG: hypothetical protein V2I33_24735, partial [Kangiellaceae bacterium]|nr:hypothetical protein [Kangiellaceae bacterium]